MAGVGVGGVDVRPGVRVDGDGAISRPLAQRVSQGVVVGVGDDQGAGDNAGGGVRFADGRGGRDGGGIGREDAHCHWNQRRAAVAVGHGEGEGVGDVGTGGAVGGGGVPCRSVRGVGERSGGLIERQGAA